MLRTLLPLLVGLSIAGCQNLHLAGPKPDPVLANQSAAKQGDVPPQNRQPSFPQLAPATRERAFPDALIEGTLTLTNGCLRITDDKISYLIVWPPQVRLDLSGDSVRVFDAKSRVTAQVGGVLRLGGGAIQPSASILKELRHPLPNKCPGPYWLASGISRR